MNQYEYREQLRTMPTSALLKDLDRVRQDLGRRVPKDWERANGLTDHWQARQLLAELACRQLELF